MQILESKSDKRETIITDNQLNRISCGESKKKKLVSLKIKKSQVWKIMSTYSISAAKIIKIQLFQQCQHN